MNFINKEDYSNQKQIVLEHIKQYGNISTIEGYELYKIMRVGSVINVLRKEGYDIVTVMEYNEKSKTRFARYFLKGGANDEIL